MDQPITHPTNLPPRNFGMYLAQIYGEIVGRLTDNFQLANNSILNYLLLEKTDRGSPLKANR